MVSQRCLRAFVRLARRRCRDLGVAFWEYIRGIFWAWMHWIPGASVLSRLSSCLVE